MGPQEPGSTYRSQGYMSDELNLLPVKGAQDLGRRLADRERRTADEGYRSTEGRSRSNLRPLQALRPMTIRPMTIRPDGEGSNLRR